MRVEKSPVRLRRTASDTVDREKPITLALQGGGSHGAFQWGVIEELLKHPELRIGAVSGASAGAMNAAMLTQGLVQGGRTGAAALLSELWHRVASEFGMPEFSALPWPWSVDAFLDAVRRTSRAMTPPCTPLGINPLRPILEDLLDPSAFGVPGAPTLVVSATRVRNGAARLFRDREVTVDALLASSCLPQSRTEKDS